MNLKKAHTIIPLFGFILIMGCSAFQKDNKQRIIEFNFYHSMRAPYHEVKIKINELSDSCVMTVISSPSPNVVNPAKWAYSKKHYKKTITSKQFSDIFHSLNRLNQRKLRKESNDHGGRDGTGWYIKWGTEKSYKEYAVWTPDYEMKDRKLRKFVEACTRIVELSGLPKEEIL